MITNTMHKINKMLIESTITKTNLGRRLRMKEHSPNFLNDDFSIGGLSCGLSIGSLSNGFSIESLLITSG